MTKDRVMSQKVQCEHYACRCARARELLAIYDRTQQGRYLREAVEVHSQHVVCRMGRANKT